jgi:hypothetical protein
MEAFEYVLSSIRYKGTIRTFDILRQIRHAEHGEHGEQVGSSGLSSKKQKLSFKSQKEAIISMLDDKFDLAVHKNDGHVNPFAESPGAIRSCMDDSFDRSWNILPHMPSLWFAIIRWTVVHEQFSNKISIVSCSVVRSFEPTIDAGAKT